MFAAHTMRFLAWTGHLTIRSFFGIAVGDVGDTTFGYDNSAVSRACPAALTVESRAPAVFRHVRLGY